MNDQAEATLLPQFSFEQRPKSAPVLCLESTCLSGIILKHNGSKRLVPLPEEPACRRASLEAGVGTEEGHATRDDDLVKMPFNDLCIVFVTNLWSYTPPPR